MSDTIKTFKQTVEKLDALAPKIEKVDWTIFDRILNDADFTKCKDALESIKTFYNHLWAHVIFPLQDEFYLQQRETGRLILEWDQQKRRADKLEHELEELRAKLQEPS